MGRRAESAILLGGIFGVFLTILISNVRELVEQRDENIENPTPIDLVVAEYMRKVAWGRILLILFRILVVVISLTTNMLPLLAGLISRYLNTGAPMLEEGTSYLIAAGVHSALEWVVKHKFGCDESGVSILFYGLILGLMFLFTVKASATYRDISRWTMYASLVSAIQIYVMSHLLYFLYRLRAIAWDKKAKSVVKRIYETARGKAKIKNVYVIPTKYIEHLGVADPFENNIYIESAAVKYLDEDEMVGVAMHELGHCRYNHGIIGLVVAVTLAAAITAICGWFIFKSKFTER